MWWWHDGWGPLGWLLMTVGMLAFWGLVAWGIVSVVRGSSRPAAPPRSPEEILDERLARGEIDAEEYRKRLDALRGSRPRSPVG